MQALQGLQVQARMPTGLLVTSVSIGDSQLFFTMWKAAEHVPALASSPLGYQLG